VYGPQPRGSMAEGVTTPVDERLVTLKREYDPDNVVRLNQNVKP
jgi:hypothetical protein